jgi:hypothetical protein
MGITHAVITVITGALRIIALTTAGGRTTTAASGFTGTTRIIIATIKQRLV